MYNVCNIGIVIKTLRKKKSLSQEALAKGICSVKQIYRIENGINSPTSLLLKEISMRLGEDIFKYLSRSHCPDPVYTEKLFRKLEICYINYHYDSILKIIAGIPLKQKVNFKFEDTSQLLGWYELTAIDHLGIQKVHKSDYFFLLRKTTNEFIGKLCISNLTFSELRILYSLLSFYDRRESKEVYLKYLLDLKETMLNKYIEIDSYILGRIYIRLAKYYSVNFQIEEAVRIINLGLSHCFENNLYILSEKFYYMRELAMFKGK